MVLNYYWTYFSSQELSFEYACQLSCLSKHSRPFQIIINVAMPLPLPYVCTSSIFNYAGYFGDWKENWFIVCNISYICHFCSTAIWSVQPLSTLCSDNCDRFHTGLASELAPFISKYIFIWSDKMLLVYAFMLFRSPSLEYLTFTSSSVCNSPVFSLPLFLEYTLSVLSGYLCTFLGFLNLNRSSFLGVC